MAKSTLPQYLTETLVADRKAQLNTIAAIIVFAYGEQKAERTTDDLGARLHKVAPHKSEKTWQNHVSAARAVIGNKAQFIDGAYNDNAEQAQAQAVILTYLTAELTKGKYTSSVDDITNWAKGKASVRAQALAREKADQEAAKAAKAAEEAAKAQQKAEQQAEQDNPTPADPATPTPSSEANNLPQEATGYPAAILPPVNAAQFLANISRKPDGTIGVEIAENLTREDLIEMMLALEAVIEQEFPVSETTTDFPAIVPPEEVAA